ncbi:MAG: hypothetical protein RLZZ40_336 [Actinomycetota bacterium]
MNGITRPTTKAICAAAVLIALQSGYSIPSSAATCDNQFIWTVDDGAATAEEPMGVMQKWSTEGTLLDSFEFNSYRRFTGDISLSADGKHLYGIAYSADSNGYWAGSDYHDVLDSYSEAGPADLQSLENTDLTLTGNRIGPDEDYQTTENGVTTFKRLEASWLVDNWALEAGYYWARGGAVIAEDTMVIDRDYWSGQLLKIDLADSRTATNWINLHDADESLIEAGQNSGFPIAEQTVFNAWGLGGDVVLMADGDVLILAWNNLFDTASGHAEASETPLLVRIHSNTSEPVLTSNDNTVTVVGRIDIPIRDGESGPNHAYGAGRAGDQLFIGTSNGYLLRMKDIPTTSSLDPIAFDVVVDSEGTTFGGAAGSNDFTVSNAECTSSTTSNLANTGVDVLPLASTGFVAISTAILLSAFRQRRPKSLSRLG